MEQKKQASSRGKINILIIDKLKNNKCPDENNIQEEKV